MQARPHDPFSHHVAPVAAVAVRTVTLYPPVTLNPPVVTVAEKLENPPPAAAPAPRKPRRSRRKRPTDAEVADAVARMDP
jgi:hypothetical protein